MAKAMRKNSKWRKISGTVTRIIFLALVGIIAGTSLYSWNASRIAGNSLPMPLGYGCAVVLSGSMEPELSVDDLVIIKQTDTFNEKDVIVYQSGKSLVIHRVVSIDGDTVITKGDANNTNDSPISRDAVKGTLVCAIPYVGVITRAISSPIGVVCILALALILLELSYRRERKQDDDDIEKIKAEIRALKQEAQQNDLFYIDDVKKDIERIEKQHKE